MGPPRGDSDKKTAEGLGDGSRFGEADSLGWGGGGGGGGGAAFVTLTSGLYE